jgi:hypothetical protein
MTCGLVLPAQAQLADKPSVLGAQRRGEAVKMPRAPASRSAWLPRIGSRAEFESLAREVDVGAAQPMLHTIFVIDRAHGDRVYYINARRTPLHEDFLRAQYLVANFDRQTLAGYYRDPSRRFVLGTIGLQPDLGAWVFEHWEGDVQTPALLRLAAAQLQASFFAPLRYKANSAQQETAAREAGLDAVTQAQILGERRFLPLNPGHAQGRLRLVADLEAPDLEDIEPTDIVVLRDVPLSLPPVAGVLTEQPSTALSHINLLVKGWGVPNAYVQDAFRALKPWDGRWVHLRVDRAGYEVTPADRPDRLPPRPRAASVRSPDLSQSAVLPLTALDRSAMPRCGGKAAVLGQVEAWRRAGRLPGTAPVPDGFCIPFGAYAAFIHQPAVAQRIAQALQTPRFDRSAAIRRQALDALRRDLVEQPFDARQEAAWVAQWQQQLGGAGVFVRSSSNSEDLANFSGAGLYTTVPNVKAEADLAKAVRTVWASVFNADAFEARRAAGIALDQVAMAVFVQRAVDSVNAGVMVTRDPFDATHLRVVYVSAKRGIGIKVVEGQRVAEQSMFDLRSHAVRRLSRSAEASELKLDASGGVSERPIEAGAPVLSDAMVERLSRVAWQIRTLMRGVEQDIEWAIDPQGRIVVLQARPYIERHSL